MNGLFNDFAEALIPSTSEQVQAMSDREIETRSRAILDKRGYPEAMTMPSADLVKLARAECDRQ